MTESTQIVVMIINSLIGIVGAFYVKTTIDTEMTVKDVIITIIVGACFGVFMVFIWFIVTDRFNKVIWRKK